MPALAVKSNLALLEALIEAESEAKVAQIIGNHSNLRWRNLGSKKYGTDINNYGPANSQQSNAIGALTEKITNSIDSLLVQACMKSMPPDSLQAPKNIFEAAKKFFDVKNGDLVNLSRSEILNLAEKIKIYVEPLSDTKNKNIWVVDSGEGQTPDKVEDTFLSVLGKNKNNIRFVHGRFNMGGLSSLPYCGEKKYQLLITRRDPSLLAGFQASHNPYSFTLIREYQDPNASNPEYQYCTDVDNKLLTIDYDSKNPLIVGYGELHRFEHGAVIKLFNYKFSGDMWSLLKSLKKFLFNPVLPFKLITKISSGEVKTRVLDGNLTRLKRQFIFSEADVDEEFEEDIDGRREKHNKIFKILLRSKDLGLLGNRKIEITIFDNRDISYYTENDKLVFFTINGQTHGTFPKSFLTKHDKLAPLENKILIHVDCSDVGPSIINQIFMSNRELMKKEEKEIVAKELDKLLESDEELIDIARHMAPEIKQEQRQTNTHKTIGKRLLKFIPDVRLDFAQGEFIFNAKKKLAKWIKQPKIERVKKEKFAGKYFPTFFRLKDWNKNKGLKYKELPINSFIKIEFETDAENGYLIRHKSPGKFLIESPSCKIAKKTGERLYNGRLYLEIRPDVDAQVNEVITPYFILTRENDKPLVVDYLSIKFTEPKSNIDENGRTKSDSDGNDAEGADLPQLIKCSGEEWLKQGWQEDYLVKFGENKIFVNMSCFESPHYIGEFDDVEHEIETAKDNFAHIMYTQALAIKRYKYLEDSENESCIESLKNEEVYNAFLRDLQNVMFSAMSLKNKKLLYDKN